MAHKGQSQFPSSQSCHLKMETDGGGNFIGEYKQADHSALEVLIPEIGEKDLSPVTKLKYQFVHPSHWLKYCRRAYGRWERRACALRVETLGASVFWCGVLWCFFFVVVFGGFLGFFFLQL